MCLLLDASVLVYVCSWMCLLLDVQQSLLPCMLQFPGGPASLDSCVRATTAVLVRGLLRGDTALNSQGMCGAPPQRGGGLENQDASRVM